MKAKKVVSLFVVVSMMILALSGIAMAAVPSPTGATAEGVSDNVKKLTISEITKSKDIKELAEAVEAIAKDDIKKALEAKGIDLSEKGIDLDEGNYELVELIQTEVKVVITGNKPGTIKMNVSGAKAGDTIFVLILLPNGETELIPVEIIADGVIQFDVTRNCLVSVIKLVPEGESAGGGANSLPATGDKSSVLPMVVLLMVSIAACAVAGKSLKNN